MADMTVEEALLKCWREFISRRDQPSLCIEERWVGSSVTVGRMTKSETASGYRASLTNALGHGPVVNRPTAEEVIRALADELEASHDADSGQ